jgi:hypothetical protein
MNTRNKRAAIVGTALITAATLSAGILTTANATQSSVGASSERPLFNSVSGQLNPLNNSGVVGKAVVKSSGRHIHVKVEAHRLAPNLPHAQHIHFGARARHECPTIADDNNGDFRLTTSEGAPAYGPIRVSLTTRGDTSKASGLAVNRFPTASGGSVDYRRATRTGKNVAQAIRRGDAVVVLHGVDYNDNGRYDFRSAGKSELDGSLPAEATDPASCGVLHR